MVDKCFCLRVRKMWSLHCMTSKVSLVLTPWAHGRRNELTRGQRWKAPSWATLVSLTGKLWPSCVKQSADRFQLLESLRAFQLLAQTLHRRLLVSGWTEVTQECSPVCPGCSFSDEPSWLQISWWLALPTDLPHPLAPFSFSTGSPLLTPLYL